MKAVKILFLAAACSLLAVNPALAQNWMQTSAPTNYWLAVASSADGTKLFALAYSDESSPIYLSTDSGFTWKRSSAPDDVWWRSVASSADGTKLVAAGLNTNIDYMPSEHWTPTQSKIDVGPIYTSSDSGKTWKQTSAPDNVGWSGVASSADGSKLVAVGCGYQLNQGIPLFISSDSGATWVQHTNLPPRIGGLASVASSADGNKLAILAMGEILVSSDFGLTWSKATKPCPKWGFYVPIRLLAMSADGNELVVGFNYVNPQGASPIYISRDFGTSWTETSAPPNHWVSIASSADGSRLVAATSWYGAAPNAIFVSTDSGASWTSNGVPDQLWTYVNITADGSKLFAAAGKWFRRPSGDDFHDGAIYAWQILPSPELSRQLPNEETAKRDSSQSGRLSISHSANHKLVLSWVLPATNFVLQQSADLVSWKDVTNKPMLDLTNQQHQVFLEPPGSNVFYRLKTP